VNLKPFFLSVEFQVSLELDLADLKSIKKFALKVTREYSRVDILINNAGVLNGVGGPGVPKCTKDGFEVHFGTNYLGHFHLTNLLSDHLKKSRSSRYEKHILITFRDHLFILLCQNTKPKYLLKRLGL
jgi:NAD(P)-dependent dehydrogenase (short-subunit alcohol dehydrogenase family)